MARRGEARWGPEYATTATTQVLVSVSVRLRQLAVPFRGGAGARIKSQEKKRGRRTSGHTRTMMAQEEKAGGERMLPLALLLKQELTNEKLESPDVLYGEATVTRKGEDFTLLKPVCHRTLADACDSFSVFAIFDGHNGTNAAVYSRENLLDNILGAIPSHLSRTEWLSVLPRALVSGFVKTDKNFEAQCSGTTVTLVIVDGWVVTVGSVGDSRCILESAEGAIYFLSADHRLDTNEKEVERVTLSGGEVGRISAGRGTEIGPLRCWPGGLCLSRSIGDMDVGDYIVPIPHVKQVKLSNAGGRLIIASDGVWDALNPEMAINCSRGLPVEVAAAQIVKEAVQLEGLRDDTTCIVVDILPPEMISASPPQKKQGRRSFRSMFRKKNSDPSVQCGIGYSSPDFVEEMFEQESAMLAERLDGEYSRFNMFKHVCVVCQVEIRPGEGTSLHIDSARRRIGEGPLLCPSCKAKKEAMERRRTPKD